VILVADAHFDGSRRVGGALSADNPIPFSLNDWQGSSLGRIVEAADKLQAQSAWLHADDDPDGQLS